MVVWEEGLRLATHLPLRARERESGIWVGGLERVGFQAQKRERVFFPPPTILRRGRSGAGRLVQSPARLA